MEAPVGCLRGAASGHGPAEAEVSDRSPLLDGAKIRARRRQLGLAERALAEAIGVDGSVVHNLERGKNDRDLPFAVIDKLATTLAVSIDELRVDHTPGAHA